MGEIWAIILAAGESTRMKTNKLLLPYFDKLIITSVIDKILQSDVDQVLVVLGAFRDEMLPVLATLPVKHCYNEDYKHGMLSSVQFGFRNLPEDARAALVCLGDQPMISTSTVNLLINGYLSSGKGILVPVYNDRRGHPILIDLKYRKAVANLDPALGLRTLVTRDSDDILEVEVDGPGILRDIDTQTDYFKETKIN